MPTPPGIKNDTKVVDLSQRARKAITELDNLVSGRTSSLRAYLQTHEDALEFAEMFVEKMNEELPRR